VAPCAVDRGAGAAWAAAAPAGSGGADRGRRRGDADIEVTHAVGDADTLLAAVDADTLLAAVDADLPDVVVTDIRMPPTFTDEGLAAALTIRARHPRVAVLVLSQYLEAAYAERLLATAPPAWATC
jgi:DNA-binding NarL/FixJ family response regulator